MNLTPKTDKLESEEIQKMNIEHHLKYSSLSVGGESFSIGNVMRHVIEETMRNEKISNQNPSKHVDHLTPSSIRLPDPSSLSLASVPDDTAAMDKYQLQLRVDEGAYKYLNKLAHLAEAETISELVRMSLRALEDASQRYEEIHRADGLIIARGEPCRYEEGANITKLRAAPTRRINVVLRAQAHDRLNRLLNDFSGLTLVDLVMTAVGVVDASLRSHEGDQTRSHSSQAANNRASARKATNTRRKKVAGHKSKREVA